MRVPRAISIVALLAAAALGARADDSPSREASGASPRDAPVSGEEAIPAQLSLAEALRLFRARGFDLLLAEAQVKSAEGDLRAAHASPNPSLSGSFSRSFDYDPNQCPGCSAIGFSVGISENGALSDLISNKRGLRIDVGEAALEAAKRSRDDARRTLELTLKQAWVAALQAEAQLALAGETMASTEKTRALNEKRFNLGAVSEADFARAEVAELEAEQLRDQATQALAAAKAQVAFLLGARRQLPAFAMDAHGLDYTIPEPLAKLAPSSSANSEAPPAVISDALEQRPDVRALASQVARAESAITLARRQRWGDPDLSVTYLQQGTGQDAIQPPTVSIGLSIPVPLLYQQQGEITKAEADLATQQISLEKARAQAAADVRQAWSQLAAARAQLERMDARLQSRAKRARDLIQIQYEKGAATLLDLLDAERTFLAVGGERITLLANYWNAVAQLEAATARELR